MNTFGAPLRPDKAVLQWDSVTKGLGIRINRDGSRLYIAKISLGGKPLWFTIGPVDMLTLDDVRGVVSRMKLLARGGHDPLPALWDFQQQKGAPDSFGVTFSKFAKIYMETYAKPFKKSWLKDQQRIDRYLMPIWQDRLLCQISRMDVVKLHQEIGKAAPVAANRLLEVISVMWKQATLMGYLPERQLKITTGIKRFKEKSRDRFLSDSEWPKLRQAIEEASGTRFQKAAILLDLELGFRCGEVITLRWDQVDFERKEIRLDETKNGRSFIQPLTAAAEELLSGLPRFNQWVFPSNRNQGQHISRIDKLLKRCCEAAGIKDFRVHDIRRSVGCSILARTGSLEMVASVLNHSSLATTKVYAKYQREHIRKALEAHSLANHQLILK